MVNWWFRSIGHQFFLYRGRFELLNALEWVPKFSPQIRWHYMSLASPDLDLETCQHSVILWAGQLKTYPLWLFKDTSLRLDQFLVIHRLWFLRCIAKSAPPKKWAKKEKSLSETWCVSDGLNLAGFSEMQVQIWSGQGDCRRNGSWTGRLRHIRNTWINLYV